jgi:hypothetical protein
MTLERLSETHDPDWWAEALRRVRNGMALLDERGPAGWRSQVNINALDMGHGLRDVLGQLYGTFHRGMCALFGEDWGDRRPEIDLLSGRTYNSFGFMPVFGISKFLLTDAWRHELWSQSNK